MRARRRITGWAVAGALWLGASASWAGNPTELSLEGGGHPYDTSGQVTTTIARWADVHFTSDPDYNQMNLVVSGNPGSSNDSVTNQMTVLVQANTQVWVAISPQPSLKLRTTRNGAAAGNDDTVACGLAMGPSPTRAFEWDLMMADGGGFGSPNHSLDTFGGLPGGTWVRDGSRAYDGTCRVLAKPGWSAGSPRQVWITGYLRSNPSYANTIAWPQPATGGYNTSVVTVSVSADTSNWGPP